VGAANGIVQPFCNLEAEVRVRIGEMGMEAKYGPGESLFAEGERSKCVFLLCSGRVQLSVTSREKRLLLWLAEAGEILGLSAAFSDSEHLITAHVVDNCVVKAVPTKEFLSFLAQQPEAAMEATRCILREYQMVLARMFLSDQP
jgi:CRP/FNR family transcriptional regulator